MALISRLRPFLIVDEDKGNQWQGDWVYKEVYDNHSLLVKPIFPSQYFELKALKDEYLKQEQVLEIEIRHTLFQAIRIHQEKIERYVQRIERLDTILAKAKFALRYAMVKPDVLPSPSPIEIVKGRFVPLMNRCKRMHTEHTALSVNFEKGTVVVSGSNMGGKTMLLKSIAFFQMLVQRGFWVPAEVYKTSIFQQLHYIGPEGQEDMDGLSSFGSEIYQLSKVLDNLHLPCLLLMDEFAKTTNSREAKGLLAALLKSFSQLEGLQCFIATHIQNLPILSGVSFYRMKGFDTMAYAKLQKDDSTDTIQERIRRISACMHYEVIKDDSNGSFDALTVAELLGLDIHIVHEALTYMNHD